MADKASTTSVEFRLNRVRLSFHDLWDPVEFKPGDGKPRYNATFLIEPGSDNAKKIEDAINTVAQVYGKKMASNLEAWEKNTQKKCYYAGEIGGYDGWEGKMVLASHSKAKPKILGQRPRREDGSENILLPEDGRPYSGCYVNAIVSVYAQQGENPGLRSSFSGVQFHSDGEAFAGGRPASADDFDEVPEEGANADDLG